MSPPPLSGQRPRDAGAPHYELHACRHGGDDLELTIWQMPASASPHLKAPLRIAGLRGRNLALVEHRVLRALARVRIDLGGLPFAQARSASLDEDLALSLGLLFRVLAPMRNREFMRAVADGIEAMGREEAAYWLGMAMHRKYPRRVLSALRMLLIDPKATA